MLTIRQAKREEEVMNRFGPYLQGETVVLKLIGANRYGFVTQEEARKPHNSRAYTHLTSRGQEVEVKIEDAIHLLADRYRGKSGNMEHYMWPAEMPLATDLKSISDVKKRVTSLEDENTALKAELDALKAAKEDQAKITKKGK